ncbi:MAG: D-2-hydroxyacid dehydrogenase [Clostridiales Family XIII bacterium]|jgi:phosphoglycerate dehydrogenase-like enzyme|nr:D-2-hydroxyacid dehydrogenase [Clostridiales Family XIII bacterium]
MANVVFLFKSTPKVPFVFQDRQLEQIAEAAGGEVYRFETEDELLASGKQAEILYTWGGTGDMPVRYCKGNPKLKWLHSFSAGMDPLMKSEIADIPIIISNSSGIHSLTIAESVMGYILAWNRTLPFMLRKQREHVWAKGMTRQPTEAFGKILGIIGAGAIGTEIAVRAKAFNMRTLALRRNPKPKECFDEIYGGDGLNELLTRSDYVVTSTPYTPETRRMIGAAQFKIMKNSALFINVARGGVVDQDALIEALGKGEIAGAALDVTDPEPLNHDSPLWDMENVIITPHMSADAPILAQLAVDFFCREIKHYLNGEPIANTIPH